MGLFDFLFSFFKKKEKDDEDAMKYARIKKVEKKKNKKKKYRGAASLLLMLMLLSSIYAEPAAALTINISSEGLGSKIMKAAGAGLAGAGVGAVAGSVVPGLGTVVGAVGGFLIGLGAGLYYEFKDGGAVVVNNDEQKYGYEDVVNDNLEKDLIDNQTVDKATLDSEAQKDLQELMNKLASGLMDYELSASGDSGEFAQVSLKAAEKIYGFSAFPVVFGLQIRGNSEVKDPIWITDVKIYVKDVNGNVYYVREWKYSEGELGGEEGTILTWQTILKVPDPYVSNIDALLAGQANDELVNELLNGVPPQFDIVVVARGYRYIYYKDPNTGNWVLDSKIPVEAVWTSVNTYKHLASGQYVVEGFKGSAPAVLQDDPEASDFVAFKYWMNGATSNLVGRVWSNPLQLLDAASAYRFYVQANKDYFAPLEPQIYDEARILVFRILKDGTWELAYALPVNGSISLGELSNLAKTVEGSVVYNSGDNVLTYRTFVVVKAYVKRDDNQEIPIWMILEPAIAVIAPQQIVVGKDEAYQIQQLILDNQIDENDKEKIASLADSMINSLNSKLQATAELSEKAQAAGNKEAIDYAEKAIEKYRDAINNLQKMKSADISDVFHYFELAKINEEQGDYYYRAAELAFYNQKEQAAALAEQAQKLEEKSGTAFAGLPFGNLGDLQGLLVANAIYILVAIALLLLMRSLFGGTGAAIILIAAAVGFLVLNGSTILSHIF